MSKSILVIDDERAVRDSFELALMDEGYEIRTAENGLDGLAAIEEKRPDLILLDLKMPGMNGVEVLRRIKAIDETISVHIVTAFQREFMEELRTASAEGLEFEVISKPLNSKQIRLIIKAKLG